MGKEAVRQMIAGIKEKKPKKEKIQFEPELVIRKSVKDLNR